MALPKECKYVPPPVALPENRHKVGLQEWKNFQRIAGKRRYGLAWSWATWGVFIPNYLQQKNIVLVSSRSKRFPHRYGSPLLTLLHLENRVFTPPDYSLEGVFSKNISVLTVAPVAGDGSRPGTTLPRYFRVFVLQ